MKILLLNVTGRALECGVERLAVNEHIACNDTHGGSLSQNIQKRSLSSSRDTHKGGQGTWFDPSINVVKDPATFFFDLNIVANILPLKNGSLLFNNSNFVRIGILHGEYAIITTLEVVLCIVLVQTFMSTAENKNFTLGLLFGDKLRCNQINSTEYDHETKDTADIFPLVRGVIAVG